MNGHLLEIQARELAGMPENWEVYSWRAIGVPGPVKLYEMKGCFKPPTITKGPKAGQPAWARRDKTSERTIHITPAEYIAWEAEWVKRTGLCSDCMGKGQTVASVGVGGTTYRECRKCKGTGKANLEPAQATA